MTSVDEILGTATEPTTEIKETIEEMITKSEATETMEGAEPSVDVAEVDNIMAALLGRIAPVEDATPYRKLMLFGPFGVGKTVFCATAPMPLIVAVEPTGPLSIGNHPDLKAKTKVFEFKSLYQLETLLDKMIEKPEAFKAICQTLIIDSFSELQKWDLDDIVTKAAAVDASRNKFLPTGPDYNINTEHLRQVASKLERIPFHVIITCHVKEEKDEATGVVRMRPNLTPKLAGTLAGKFDVVAYMAINGQGDQAVRTLQIGPTNTVMAKTRIGNLPLILDNPTFDSLFIPDKVN